MVDDAAAVNAVLQAGSAPADLAAELLGAEAEVVPTGTSASTVVRFVGSERTLYAKYGPDLVAEAERLRWLVGRWGAPTVEHIGSDGDDPTVDLLITTEVAGLPSQLAMAGDPNAVVAAYGAELAVLHRMPVADCPFDARPDTLHDAAQTRAASEDLAVEGFGGMYDHLTPPELFERLEVMRPTRPSEAELVVVHGDYSMPNVLFAGARLSGVLDVGRLGVGDRYCDLGVAARSLIRNLGPEALPVFFDAYGLGEPEMLRLEYHVVLDEFR